MTPRPRFDRHCAHNSGSHFARFARESSPSLTKEGRPGLSVVTRHGYHHEIPAFQLVHAVVSRVSSIHVITSFSTRRFLAAARL